MVDFKITNENGLELTVSESYGKKHEIIIGGMDTNPTWKEYLEGYKEEFHPHFELIKRAIEELGWIGETAETYANNTCFGFSDGNSIGFTWRAWGDLMQSIVGKREGYMQYYM